MEEKILKIIERVNEDILTYDGKNMLEEGIVNSFEIIEIISMLEEELEIDIDAEYVVAENFANLSSIITLIKKIIEE